MTIAWWRSWVGLGTPLSMVWNDVPHASVTGQGPLGGTQSWVTFTPLGLAHAVVKADSARSLPPWTIYRRAWGLLLYEWGDALVPSNGNLRLNAEGYVDFVGTSLVGRLGQGLALLYAQSQGYTYVGHYSQVVAGGGRRSSAGGPDFVLEKSRGGTRALLEAKGARDRRDVRQRLRNAMRQIQAGFATTNAQEGYATAAILEEVDDRSDSEGFVTRVPNAQYAAQPMGNRVARVNYGTWAQAMGLFGLATRLLRGPNRRAFQKRRRSPFSRWAGCSLPSRRSGRPSFSVRRGGTDYLCGKICLFRPWGSGCLPFARWPRRYARDGSSEPTSSRRRRRGSRRPMTVW